MDRSHLVAHVLDNRCFPTKQNADQVRWVDGRLIPGDLMSKFLFPDITRAS